MILSILPVISLLVGVFLVGSLGQVNLKSLLHKEVGAPAGNVWLVGFGLALIVAGILFL